jgi:hypothetical protein
MPWSPHRPRTLVRHPRPRRTNPAYRPAHRHNRDLTGASAASPPPRFSRALSELAAQGHLELVMATDQGGAGASGRRPGRTTRRRPTRGESRGRPSSPSCPLPRLLGRPSGSSNRPYGDRAGPAHRYRWTRAMTENGPTHPCPDEPRRWCWRLGLRRFPERVAGALTAWHRCGTLARRGTRVPPAGGTCVRRRGALPR